MTAVGVLAAVAALYVLARAARRRYRTWEWAALTCPHRSPLRRYRWTLTVIGTIRVGPGYLAHTIRRRRT